MRSTLAAVMLVGLAAVGCGESGTTASVGSKACMSLASCDLFDFNVSQCSFGAALLGSDYWSNVFKIEPEQVTCLAAAGSDCDAARKCLNKGAAPATCSGGRSCEGTVLVLCEDNLAAPGTRGTRRFDCASANLSCIANGATLDCGTASCSGLNASCSGNDLLYCQGDGVQRRYPCSESNATCVTTGIAPHCRGTGAACSQQSGNPLQPPPIRCDGTKVVFCVDGQEAPFDCGPYGLGCFANANDADFGCAFGNACDDDYNATCDANAKLTFCNGGNVDVFDCKGAGYSSCSPNDGGACIK